MEVTFFLSVAPANVDLINKKIMKTVRIKIANNLKMLAIGSGHAEHSKDPVRL